jgi:hypothetical protein
MNANVLETTLTAHLTEMSKSLDQATGIAEAAEACAKAGNIEKSIEIAFDIEQLVYEVNAFLNAASLLHRIYRT